MPRPCLKAGAGLCKASLFAHFKQPGKQQTQTKPGCCCRYTSTIVAAILHDVIDDTHVDLSSIRSSFGSLVADMVSNVSRLSQMNQLLRRGKRQVCMEMISGCRGRS